MDESFERAVAVSTYLLVLNVSQVPEKNLTNLTSSNELKINAFLQSQDIRNEPKVILKGLCPEHCIHPSPAEVTVGVVGLEVVDAWCVGEVAVQHEICQLHWSKWLAVGVNK